MIEYAAENLVSALHSMDVERDTESRVTGHGVVVSERTRAECVAFAQRSFIYRSVIAESESGDELFVLTATLDAEDVEGCEPDTFALASCPLHEQFGMSLFTMVSEVGATLPWLNLAVTRRMSGELSDDITDIASAFKRIENSANDLRDQVLMLEKNPAFGDTLDVTRYTSLRGLFASLARCGVVSMGKNNYAPVVVSDGLMFTVFLLELYGVMRDNYNKLCRMQAQVQRAVEQARQ
jgi:hypothetical protein